MDVFDYPELQPKLYLDTTDLDAFKATFDETRITSHTGHWHLLHPSERVGRLAHITGLIRQLAISDPHKDELISGFRLEAQLAANRYTATGKAQRDKLDAQYRAEKIAQREAARRKNAKALQTGRPVRMITELGWAERLDDCRKLLAEIITAEEAGRLPSEHVDDLGRRLMALGGSVKQRAERLARQERHEKTIDKGKGA